MDQFSAAGEDGAAEAATASGASGASSADAGATGDNGTSAQTGAGGGADPGTGPGPGPGRGVERGAETGNRTGGGESEGAPQAWAALGGDPALLARVARTRRPGLLPSALPVQELAAATVTACALAAAEFSCVRERSAVLPSVQVDDGAVAAAFHSERHLRIDGRDPVNFAPLSRYWRTSDGWVRTHANYPHHRARLLGALGLGTEDGSGSGSTGTTGGTGATADDEAFAAKVAAEFAGREAVEVEDAVFAAGGLAVAVRTPHAWLAHPQRAAVVNAPLVATSRLDNAPPLPLDGRPGPGGLQGLRVLDLTRVLAGPVATRTLGLLGADVLRIDPPQYPELTDTYADTGLGKRSTALDLASRSGQATFEELLASAHVVVTGYRPGALDRFGLAPESLADRRPGLVVGQLCAWGGSGPWQRRRGFDSLVQAATGIAHIEGEARAAGGEDAPGAMPAQALDHGSGYLLAGALLRCLTEQRTGTGGSRVVRLALARTAEWLLRELPREQDTGPAHPFDPTPWTAEADSPLGRLRHVRSPVAFGRHTPSTWTRMPGPPGTDPSAWS
ncbi:CoA transferase [Streptomyces albiaxialis]|uniref:CoA transferase n=2 Tax=Streptomyces albiaxialis TaxID=329523 RepID=A0ABN2WHU0_9ACTN